MSRPFSYSDENFTVIGNMLFCHIKITKPVLKGEPLAEIPPAIFARMLFITQAFYQVFVDLQGERKSYYTIESYVKLDGKKYFLFSKDDATVVGSYVIGYYILKDI